MYVHEKQAVDMSPAEYRKFIFRSGVDRPYGWKRRIVTLNATGSGLDSDGELKQVIDMSSKEYAKYIAQSGVQDTHGGGKIITMNASGSKEMTTRERTLTGLGIVIGGAGLVIAYSEILRVKNIEKHKFMGLTMISILVGGAVVGGMLGNKLGKKWQASADSKKK
jgi:hypothetical protein